MPLQQLKHRSSRPEVTEKHCLFLVEPSGSVGLQDGPPAESC